MQENEEEKEVININNSFHSDTSSQSKKRKTGLGLKIETPRRVNMTKKSEEKKKDKNDFIKDDRLKEKLDKFTKSILDKDSSIDSHSVSRNTLVKNDVDWKAKRREFLERLKVKKTEEEVIKRQTLEESNINLEKKQTNVKSKKCVIF